MKMISPVSEATRLSTQTKSSQTNMNLNHFDQPGAGNTYLEVPYGEKDLAKALGARWDQGLVRWYAPPHMDLSVFRPWLRTRIYLACVGGDDDHITAQEYGAKWDRAIGKLYITDDIDPKPFAAFGILPEEKKMFWGV